MHEALDSRLRRLSLKHVDGPPLGRLETALRNLALEVSLYIAFREPLPLHLRQYAAKPVPGESAVHGDLGGIRTVQRHDARSLFLSLRQHGMEELHSLDDLARLLLDAPAEWAALLPLPSNEATARDLRSLRHIAWECFAGEYIRDYLWLVEDPKQFDQNVARFLFERLVNRIAHGRRRHHRITPLYGLRLDGREVLLSPRVRLRPATDFERHLWLNPDDLHSDIPVRGLEVLGLVSVIECEESDEEAQGISPLFNLLNPQMSALEAAAVASLKLMADPSAVEEVIQPAFMERRSEGSIYEYQQRCSLMSRPGHSHGGGLPLDGKQRQQLQSLFERIHPLFDAKGSQKLSAAERSLGVALTRWLLSFHRGEPKDWLIDCWVALEGLFTQRGEAQLTEKCATRISQELEQLGAGSANQLYKEVRASYQCRCEIVHGEREVKWDYSRHAWGTRRHLSLILRHRLLRTPGGAATTA
ncbi:hypothetical protein HMI49_15250 [Corallococcus exercitus]|uniref:Apea-like HEPN domain-containing protein n=1 Tax=Corallococcus exercitus TaxID=2316736 RepID=A0A7Y4KIQ9_9BACT|nr:HEPN domain-containing protein [Corallococcus exercitus]NOK34556.1 hypothetical protein [Corallococcus exercitus]